MYPSTAIVKRSLNRYLRLPSGVIVEGGNGGEVSVSPSQWTNPNSTLTDFVWVADASLFPQSWWDAWDTDDVGKGRVFKSGGQEIASEWVGFGRVAQVGIIWGIWSGSLNTSGNELPVVYAPLASRTSYAVTDTFGRNAAYTNEKGRWHLNEDPSGTAPQITDVTGNGNDGTSVGSMTSGDLVAGKLGNAISFDGTDDWIEMNNGFSAPTAFTQSAWVKTSLTDIMAIGGQWSGNDGFFFRADGVTNGLRAWVDIINLQSGQQVSGDGSWELVHQVWDGANIIVYQNGVQTGTTAQATITAETTIPFTIATYAQGSVPWNGEIDEYRVVFNSTLSADYISLEYSNQNDPATFWGTWSLN